MNIFTVAFFEKFNFPLVKLTKRRKSGCARRQFFSFSRAIFTKKGQKLLVIYDIDFKALSDYNYKQNSAII